MQPGAPEPEREPWIGLDTRELGDAAFLDEVFDRALEGLRAGLDLDPARACALRPHLRAEIESTEALARESAFGGAAALPEVPGYELVRELGCGASGAVYLARQRRVEGRFAALKVIPFAAPGDGRSRERFLAEVRALARVRHRHVVAILDVVAAEGVCAYAVEWVEGMTLARLVERLGGAAAGATGAEPAALPAGLDRERPARFFCRVAAELARAADASALRAEPAPPADGR